MKFATIIIDINETNVFFTSDDHFQHKNIIKYCNRPFKTVRDMDSILVKNWNSVVGPDDYVFHAGDFCFGSKSSWAYLLDALNGKKYLAAGNHDKNITPDKFIDVQHRFNIRIIGDPEMESDGQRITVDHYAMLTWYQSHRGAWQLFGHCIDLDSEILTHSGWKKRENINKFDKILTLNTQTNNLEYNNINNIFDYNYVGNVYSYHGKSIDFRVTEEHNLIEILRNKKNNYRYYKAHEFTNVERRKFIKSGVLHQSEVDLSDDEIRLMVQIAADGNLCNSDLCRLKVSKDKKIKNIKFLLEKLNLKFSSLKQKDESVSFNFTVPLKFSKLRLKPISEIVLKFNEQQFDILVDEYSKSDGYKNNNTVIIYTSKELEMELISRAAIMNGYACNISERIEHGYSKGINFEISLTKRQHNVVSNLKKCEYLVEHVNGEHFWCIEVDNHNFFIRRNGKIHLTGNSHGGLSNKDDMRTTPNQLDVGVDVHNFIPISYDQVKTIITKQNLEKR